MNKSTKLSFADKIVSMLNDQSSLSCGMAFNLALDSLHGMRSLTMSIEDKTSIRTALWQRQDGAEQVGREFPNLNLDHAWTTAPLPNRYVSEFANALAQHLQEFPKSRAAEECKDFIDHYPGHWAAAKQAHTLSETTPIEALELA